MRFGKSFVSISFMVLAFAGCVATRTAPALSWLTDGADSAGECRPQFTDGVRLIREGDRQAASFPGTPGAMAVFEAPALSNLTIAAWVKVDGVGQGDKPYPRIIETPGFYLHLTASPGGLARAGLTFGTVTSGKRSAWSLDSNMLTGRWAHVALTCAGGVTSAPVFYVNGQAQTGDLTAKPLPAVFRGGKAAFGNSPGGTRPFHGEMADARLYGALLTPGEIRGLARRAPDGKPPADVKIVYRDELPVIDISRDLQRHTVIAAGTETVYQGHPTTVLMPDNRTLFAIWTLEHGGAAGPAARSDDAGVTWKRIDSLFPEVYKTHRNCPAIYRIVAPDGTERLMIFSNKHGIGRMVSEDGGQSWRELPPLPLRRVGMPFTGLVRLKDGSTAAFGQVGTESGRRPPKSGKIGQSVFMIVTKDGGLSFGEPRVIAYKDGKDLCEPFVLRSPDGGELCCLMRENFHLGNSMMCFSRDEGRTWSEPVDTPWGLTGDRHEGIQTPDGRWVIAFRDRALRSSTYGHFVAWVGTYDDIRQCRPGQFRVKLLHSFAKWDCGYPGMECLPDGTLLATTYVKYWPDARRHSVVMTRFRLSEINL